MRGGRFTDVVEGTYQCPTIVCTIVFPFLPHPHARSVRQIDTGEWVLLYGVELGGQSGWGGVGEGPPRSFVVGLPSRIGVEGIIEQRTTANSLVGGVRGGFVFVDGGGSTKRW